MAGMMVRYLHVSPNCRCGFGASVICYFWKIIYFLFFDKLVGLHRPSLSALCVSSLSFSSYCVVSVFAPI